MLLFSLQSISPIDLSLPRVLATLKPGHVYSNQMDATGDDAASSSEVQVVGEDAAAATGTEVDDAVHQDDPRFRTLSQEEVLRKKSAFQYPAGFCEVPPVLRVKTDMYLDNFVMGVEMKYKDVSEKKSQRTTKGYMKETIKIHFWCFMTEHCACSSMGLACQSKVSYQRIDCVSYKKLCMTEQPPSFCPCSRQITFMKLEQTGLATT